jgi:hypothetical protein
MGKASRAVTNGLPPITEKRFMQQIVELARLHGWQTYHTYDSRRSAEGFPDLVLCKPPRLVFLEVKAERGKTTWAQDWWSQALEGVSEVGAHVVRPKDWPAITEVLRR